MADGCTSGHGISGAMQLSVGSWIALLGFFVGGSYRDASVLRLKSEIMAQDDTSQGTMSGEGMPDIEREAPVGILRA